MAHPNTRLTSADFLQIHPAARGPRAARQSIFDFVRQTVPEAMHAYDTPVHGELPASHEASFFTELPQIAETINEKLDAVPTALGNIARSIFKRNASRRNESEDLQPVVLTATQRAHQPLVIKRKSHDEAIHAQTGTPYSAIVRDSLRTIAESVRHYAFSVEGARELRERASRAAEAVRYHTLRKGSLGDLKQKPTSRTIAPLSPLEAAIELYKHTTVSDGVKHFTLTVKDVLQDPRVAGKVTANQLYRAIPAAQRRAQALEVSFNSPQDTARINRAFEMYNAHSQAIAMDRGMTAAKLYEHARTSGERDESKAVGEIARKLGVTRQTIRSDLEKHHDRYRTRMEMHRAALKLIEQTTGPSVATVIQYDPGKLAMQARSTTSDFTHAAAPYHQQRDL